MTTNTEHKLIVLSNIAEEFNKNQVTWCVGASLLLYLKGMVNEFHDIDLMIGEKDICKVKEILSTIGVLQSNKANAQYNSKSFMEYKIDGVDVDIIAGFVIVNDKVAYDCPLLEEDIVEKILILNQVIPLHSIHVWERYYQLMNRFDKVGIIQNFK